MTTPNKEKARHQSVTSENIQANDSTSCTEECRSYISILSNCLADAVFHREFDAEFQRLAMLATQLPLNDKPAMVQHITQALAFRGIKGGES